MYNLLLKNTFKSLGLACLCYAVPLFTFAQKLPKVQKNSLRAPNNIKIDGLATEWYNQFQAYNASSRIYYTMANDDDNIYLIVRTKDDWGNKKAIYGISLTITLPDERNSKSKKKIVVTYPPLSETQKTESILKIVRRLKTLQSDTSSAAKVKIASLRPSLNKQLIITFNQISMSGIADIQEPLLSIDNTTGIKVAALYNDNMRYTYELSLPLRYLGASINDGKKFNYDIKMNGQPEAPPNSFPTPALNGGVMESEGQDNAYASYPTDFSGWYTLAKK